MEFEIWQAKVFEKVATFRRSVYWETEEQNGRDVHLEIVSVSLLTLGTWNFIFVFISENERCILHQRLSEYFTLMSACRPRHEVV